MRRARDRIWKSFDGIVLWCVERRYRGGDALEDRCCLSLGMSFVLEICRCCLVVYPMLCVCKLDQRKYENKIKEWQGSQSDQKGKR